MENFYGNFWTDCRQYVDYDISYRFNYKTKCTCGKEIEFDGKDNIEGKMCPNWDCWIEDDLREEVLIILREMFEIKIGKKELELDIIEEKSVFNNTDGLNKFQEPDCSEYYKKNFTLDLKGYYCIICYECRYEPNSMSSSPHDDHSFSCVVYNNAKFRDIEWEKITKN